MMNLAIVYFMSKTVIFFVCALYSIPNLFANELQNIDHFESKEPFVVVKDIKFQGLQRTDPEWIRSYVNLTTPIKMTREEALSIARKLMTTGIFSDVKINFKTLEYSQNFTAENVILEILVEEKWTTIPVFRAAFGGGTPLRVLGGYDTHLYGKLLTFGAEFRKYGDAPPGFVVFFRSPKSNNGKEYFGIEAWNDRRIRDTYNDHREIVGQLKVHSQKIKFRYFSEPFSDSQWLIPSHLRSIPSHFKLGIESKIIRLFPTLYNRAPNIDYDVSHNYHDENNVSYLVDALPSVLFDSIETGVLDLEGMRIRYLFGPTIYNYNLGSSQELDLYYYKMLPFDINAASHLFIKSNSQSTTATDQFIGGFDSVRGFPDGYKYGSAAYFTNIELRRVIFRSKYLWIQSLGFLDWGNALPDWRSFHSSKPLASTGVGFRFAVPQVYRLMFRIDYAWSLTEKSQGLSGGMNQFFDPYNPL
jgi:hypothetical protein